MHALFANDAPGVYPNSYYAETAAPLDPFPALDGDIRTEICVIGAGFAGLSAALHLRQAGHDVVLIEAQRVGWGASGRNGGQMGTGQRLDQEALEARFGLERAKTLWALSESAKQLVRDLADRHRIACELRPGIVYADHKKRFVAHTRAYVEHLNAVYGYDKISFLDRAALSQAIGTDVYFGASLDWGAGHLHPLKFALGLARAARDAGVKIFENTAATAISHTDPARIATPAGTITADRVLIAANGYLGDLESEIAKRVMPINSYMIATEPMGEQRARALVPDNVAIADSRFVVNYYRLSADHRMLFGGRESYGYRFPNDIATKTRARMLSIYPDLGDLEITHAWGGTLGITLNRMPHFARLAPNILSAGGFSGHGVAMATLSGKLMAKALKGDGTGFAAMEAVPTPRFPGGVAFRRPLLVLAMLYFSLRDRL